MTRKPLGPTGQMEMEKGPIGTRDMQDVGSHRSDGDGEWSHKYCLHQNLGEERGNS